MGKTEESSLGTQGNPQTSPKPQVALNIITLLLLFGLCFAVALMPKYNYAHYATRLSNLEAKAYTLENGFSKINLLAGGTENQRAAVLGRIDFIYEHLHSLENEALSFLENLATLSLTNLGTAREPQDIKSAVVVGTSKTNDRTVATNGVEPPCSNLEDCLSKYFGNSRPTPRTMHQMTFEDLLAELSYAGKRSAGQSAGGLPVELIEPLFKVYKSCVETINRNETLYTDVLVQEAIRSGSYVDISTSNVGDEEPGTKVLTPADKGSLTYVAFMEDGRRLQFAFPYFEDPNFQKYEDLRKRALESFLILLDVIMNANIQKH